MPEPITLLGAGGGMVALLIYLARRFFGAAKEVVDILLGVVVGLLALPLIGVCALVVRLSSRGPVFFGQIRVGRGGNLFRMWKLRTMYVDAESTSGAVWAQDRDPRVIRACRWMRRSHLDELPQLWNVVKGEMSLVGPRPERPEILAELEKHYPQVRQRLAVKPGITGLAQVRNGYDTGIEQFRAKLQADLEYIERRKWSMELGILARTLWKLNDSQAR